MVSINIWGPSCWTFFHTIIAKIKPEDFTKVRDGLLHNLRIISQNLPCPYCSMHAKSFFQRQKNLSFNTKEEMANFFWFFHNHVNALKKKTQFPESDLSIYHNKNLRDVYSQFINHYTSKDNGLKMLSETMYRKNVAKGVHQWMRINNKSFMI